MDEEKQVGKVGEGEEYPAIGDVGELREEDVSEADALDDRVEEEVLPGDVG